MELSSKIFSHLNEEYVAKWEGLKTGRNNGAYYYSKEIVENIIPRVKTDRPWVTINVEGNCCDHAIVFLHKNTHLEIYSWLLDYKDLVLVVSNKLTGQAVRGLGKVIYLPLSVDVDYVKQFVVDEHDKENCYVGNMWGFKIPDLRRYLPKKVDIITELPREEILTKMAHYKNVYAVGRCAVEAKILGCNVKVCDHRYPDPDEWQVLDNKDAAKILQEELNKIDKEK